MLQVAKQKLKKQLLKLRMAMAGYFGDGEIHAEDLVSGILGAVVKDPVQDKVVWQEYMETVVKNRDGWKDIYRASRDMI